MGLYKAKKINVIDAEQFLPPNQIPRGVMNVYQLPNSTEHTGQVLTAQGVRVRVQSGEWIVKEANMEGRYYPIADDIFKDKYEPK